MALPSKNLAYFIKTQTFTWTWTSKSEDPTSIKTNFCVCDKRKSNVVSYPCASVTCFVLTSFCNRGHPFEGNCVSSCALKCLRICSLRAERGIASLRDPQVWSCALSLPCHVKEAVCQLDILENGSWKKEICNSRQTTKSENKQNIKNRSSCVLWLFTFKSWRFSSLGHILSREEPIMVDFLHVINICI